MKFNVNVNSPFMYVCVCSHCYDFNVCSLAPSRMTQLHSLDFHSIYVWFCSMFTTLSICMFFVHYVAVCVFVRLCMFTEIFLGITMASHQFNVQPKNKVCCCEIQSLHILDTARLCNCVFHELELNNFRTNSIFWLLLDVLWSTISIIVCNAESYVDHRIYGNHWTSFLVCFLFAFSCPTFGVSRRSPI